MISLSESIGRGSIGPLPKPSASFFYPRVITKEGRVKHTRHLNYDTMEITVECDDADGQPPIFPSAGQYGTLLADAPGAPETPRAFSFCRSPLRERLNEHTFLVRLVPGGRFSGWLFAEDRTGVKMTVTGPLGRFAMDERKNPLVCIAGGSGISGIKALLEDAVERQVARDCFFIYGARSVRDLYYEEEIREIKEHWHEGHQFEFVQVLSDESGDSWEGARGMVADYCRKNYCESETLDARNCSYLICGPPPMVEATESMLVESGVRRENIRFDKFADAQSAAPVIDNRKCVLCEECLFVRPINDCIVEIASTHSANKGRRGEGVEFSKIEGGRSAGLYYKTLMVDEKKCIRCQSCVEVCPVGAFEPQPIPYNWALSELGR